MFCPRCGKEIKNNQRFCINCGYDLSEEIDNDIKDDFYKKSYYKNPIKKKRQTNIDLNCILTIFYKLIFCFVAILVLLLGIKFAFNYVSESPFGLDRVKYSQYMNDPSSIPELIQPESLQDLVKNLKDVQNFLVLYLRYSNDSIDEKVAVFDNYRKQLLKIETFSNENLLKEDIKNSIPRNKQEFNKCAKYYNKVLSPVGFKIVSDSTYGKYHLKEDYRYTYKKFGNYLPAELKSYLYLRAKHNGEILENGGFLAVSPKEMNGRIADYEKYLNDNMNSTQKNEIQDMLYYYAFAYIFVNDRNEMKAIKSKTFKKWDKRFVRKHKNSKLIPIFSKMITSANGISENQFNNLYPYEYNPMLNSIRPFNNELDDIFAPVRKNFMKDIANVGYKYVYNQSDGIWSEFNENVTLTKDSILLADNGQGFDVYNNKLKKMNQVIDVSENTKVILKRGQLLIYNPQVLQISKVEYTYGGFSVKVIPSKIIRQYFPEVLIINVDNIGSSPVQVTKTTELQAYMLISHAGSNFDGYILQSDLPITNGELSNIFTISTTNPVNIEWIPSSGDGKQYYITFVTSMQEQKSETTAEE